MKRKLHMKRRKERATSGKSSKAARASATPDVFKWPSLQQLRFELRNASVSTGCPYHFDRAF
jgi:hypothetical protein